MFDSVRVQNNLLIFDRHDMRISRQFPLQLLHRLHALMSQFWRDIIIGVIVRMLAGEHVARIADDVDDENPIALRVMRQS